MNYYKQIWAIGEYIGYKNLKIIEGESPFSGVFVDNPNLQNSIPRIRLPNYTNDLNAMHEAEKTIPKRDKCIYANYLMMVVGFDGETDMVDDYGEWSTSKTTSLFSILNATAAQRAEAFLKTIGKWEE
jgi:hypothetical protein